MNSKSHAEHNEKLCNHLHSIGEYNDWVITTAFYSSLHFVHHKIFPFTIGAIKYESIERYYMVEIKAKRIKMSKHQATIQLVKKHLPSIGSLYEWLFDVCMNARYTNYNISPDKANKAIERLGEIKKMCVS